MSQIQQKKVQMSSLNQVRNQYLYLNSRRATSLDFYNRFIAQPQKKQCQFPIGNGYPILSDDCKDPQCIIFIPKEQIGASMIPSIIKGQQIKCPNEKCKAHYSRFTLWYQDDFQQLLSRNFTEDQKNRLKKVIITKDLQVIAQKNQHWNQLQKKVNRTRLQIVSQLLPQLKQKQIYNKKEQYQKQKIIQNDWSINVDTINIYNELKNQFNKLDVGKQSKKLALENYKQHKYNQQDDFLDSCLLFQSRDKKNLKILRYFNQGNSFKFNSYYLLKNTQNQQIQQAKYQSSYFQRFTLNGDQYKFRIAYDKYKKNIYFLSEKGQLFYSNFTNLFDLFKEGAVLIKMGKVKLPSQVFQKINLEGKQFLSSFYLSCVKDYLYIIGGKSNQQKHIREILRINISQEVVKNEDKQINCVYVADLNNQNKYIEITTKGDKIFVYGANTQVIQDKQQTISTIQMIDTQKINNQILKAQVILQNQKQLNIIGCSISAITDSIFIIAGGLFDLNFSNVKSYNKEILIIDTKNQSNQKIIYKEIIMNMRIKDLNEQGFSDSMKGVNIFIRNAKDHKQEFLFTKVRKLDKNLWGIVNQAKKIQ